MTLKEDYKLAKRIDELLCTEFDKRNPGVQDAAKSHGLGCSSIFVGTTMEDFAEHYCLMMAEKKALREFGRFEELKRIYGEDK